jgi:hypothetical protein
VVSKKDIGDRKMAFAISSCNFREACVEEVSGEVLVPCLGEVEFTNLDGAEDPKDEGLDDCQEG